ncbi:MAG: CoA transferase, partial [Burkholderiales bacterium]|nr:CoA transferase [Burkholderiales bacterium]
MSAEQVLQTLWQYSDWNAEALQEARFSGGREQLPSTYQVGDLACATIAAQALAAAQIWQQRTGETQLIDVDRRHALAMFRSERYLRLNGQPPADPWSPIAGYYQAGDGRWLQLHTNFPHHSAGVTRVLNCQADRTSVAQAISHWNAATLDATLAEQGLCAAMIRTYDEWRAHPQAKAIAALPLFDIEKIDEAPAVS